MLKKTIGESIFLLVLALLIALVYHFLSPSGITIFKKRPPAPAVSSPGAHIPGGPHGA